jgi:predicted O-linked N-acetylglucosamine transferase (SPINDLY family)
VRLAARAAFDHRFVRPIMARDRRTHPNDPDPDRRLRIGYVSSDLFACSAAFCHGAVILGSRHGDHVTVYFTQSPRATPGDEVTGVFREAADVWQDVTALADEAVADLIRRDEIDVLVDLGGYSSGGRMLVFAHRPAPVQVTGWGHATGTDLSCFDYTVADAATVPDGDEHRHREAILRVPSIITYVPSGAYPITYTPTTPVTFGYLGRSEKLSSACLGAWADILHAVPDSRLLLKNGDWSDPAVRAQVLIPLGALGIGTDRIELRGATPNGEHLLTYNEVDVHLDAFPHGGGVTTLDACWMGCPTVTLRCSTIPGRVGSSILTTLGRRGWIAESIEDYCTTAIEAARAAPYRDAESRERLRMTMRNSVLVDAYQYAAAVEGGFRSAWRRWCATQASSEDERDWTSVTGEAGAAVATIAS